MLQINLTSCVKYSKQIVFLKDDCTILKSFANNFISKGHEYMWAKL